MPNKDRLLLLLKMLQKQTDEDTWLSTEEIRRALEKEDVACSVRTLRTDIRALKDSGYEIAVEEKKNRQTRYAWLDREWSKPELQILIDAVSAAQFIPVARSEELTEKLAAMAGPSHTEELKPQILISEHIKAKNRNMIYSVQAIRKGIEQNKKIVFRYLRYTTDMKQVPKQNEEGEEADYIVSPYALIWKKDRYYMVGWSEKHEAVAHFRIDRMGMPKSTGDPRRPAPKDFRPEDRTDRIFSMFDGPEETITLHCKKHLIGQVIDQFGEGIQISKTNDDMLEIIVTVHLSPTFYGWVFTWGGDVKIEGPENVLAGYREMLGKALQE